MRIFEKLYDGCIRLARHRRAVWFLGGNSFIESIFWPVPVDVMLAPMCIAVPEKSYRYAAIATVTSVLGAAVGYYAGYYLYDLYLEDLFEALKWTAAMDSVREYLQRFGVFFVILGSFTPLPYKIVAVCCGLAAARHLAGVPGWQLGIWVFTAVSLLGRGSRFFLIAWLIRLGGARMEAAIRKYINAIGWAVVGLAALFLCWYAAFGD